MVRERDVERKNLGRNGSNKLSGEVQNDTRMVRFDSHATNKLYGWEDREVWEDGVVWNFQMVTMSVFWIEMDVIKCLPLYWPLYSSLSRPLAPYSWLTT